MTKEEALIIIEKYLPWSEIRGEHWGKSNDPKAYPEVLEAWRTLTIGESLHRPQTPTTGLNSVWGKL